MEIIRKKDAPNREYKEEKRIYYMFDEYEFILTEIPAGHKQPWHGHKIIQETNFNIKGKVQVLEKDNTDILRPGDLVVFPPGKYHTIYNNSNSPALILTLKNIPGDKNFRNVFKNDKKIR